MNKTLNYYNNHAQIFFESTYFIEMESLYLPFLSHLNSNATILDLGCGSGRDTLAFKKLGFNVEAIDYANELVKKASFLTGIHVRCESFYELNEVAKYDGIWACASLLHCERARLLDVLNRIIVALKPYGIFYMSFKYGEGEREKDGRFFVDLNDQQAEVLLSQITGIILVKQWVTEDKRVDRTEKWLNILIRKE